MSTATVTKKCSCCKEIKGLDEFNRNKNGKFGRDSQCKACKSAYAKTEQAKENHRAACLRYIRTEKGRKCAREISLRYYHSPKGKAYSAAYAKTDKCKANVARYRQSAKGKAKRAAYAQSVEGKAAQTRYRQSAKSKAVQRKAHKREREKYPDRIKARRAVNNAVRDGHLPNAKTHVCEHCGKQAILYHHFKGYEHKHRFDVIPLCRSCDLLDHRQMSLAKSS